MKFLLFGALGIGVLTTTAVLADNHTNECIRKAGDSNCSVFNNCCDFRCSRAGKKRSTCILEYGQIQTPQSECFCSPQAAPIEISNPKRLSKLDLIAGILLIFVVDLLLLSFTF